MIKFQYIVMFSVGLLCSSALQAKNLLKCDYESKWYKMDRIDVEERTVEGFSINKQKDDLYELLFTSYTEFKPVDPKNVSELGQRFLHFMKNRPKTEKETVARNLKCLSEEDSLLVYCASTDERVVPEGDDDSKLSIREFTTRIKTDEAPGMREARKGTFKVHKVSRLLINRLHSLVLDQVYLVRDSKLKDVGFPIELCSRD